jgi:hypothetical protein
MCITRSSQSKHTSTEHLTNGRLPQRRLQRLKFLALLLHGPLLLTLARFVIHRFVGDFAEAGPYRSHDLAYTLRYHKYVLLGVCCWYSLMFRCP